MSLHESTEMTQFFISDIIQAQADKLSSAPFLHDCEFNSIKIEEAKENIARGNFSVLHSPSVDIRSK